MSQTTAEYNTKAPTFLSGAAFHQGALVKFNGSGKLVVCTATDIPRMVANREAFGADEPISVTLIHQAGLIKVRASEAIAAEAVAYADAGGEVQSVTAGTIPVGIVVPLANRPNGGAATDAGDYIVLLPMNLAPPAA